MEKSTEKRSLKEIQEDVEYLRNWEEFATGVFLGNIGYAAIRTYLEGPRKSTRELKDITLEYLSKITDLRKKYESELEKARRELLNKI